MTHIRLNLFALVFGILSGCTEAEVFRCTDAQGGVSYQRGRCERGVATGISDRREPAGVNRPDPTKPSATGSGRAAGPESRRRGRRSLAAKWAFKAEHPCPANGARRGHCPGYIIDHIKPLACGGADDPSNMQWQTEADAKAKDRWERRGCRRGRDMGATDTPATWNGRPVFIGPKGGRYIWTENGTKRYLPRW